MRGLLLAIIVLMLSAGAIVAENLAGRMDCKVKSNKIIEIVEGLPEEYSHFTDQFVVGDKLSFHYSLEDRNFSFNLEDKIRRKDVSRIEVYRHNIESLHHTGADAGVSSATSRLEFNPNFLYGTGIFNSSLHFTRYYKSDWQGLVARTTGLQQHQTFTLDCRHSVDRIDEIIEAIKDLEE